MLRASSLLPRLRDLPMPIGTPSYVRGEDPLCRASIFDDLSRAEKAAVVQGAVGQAGAERAVGCIVGMAVGDAVGAPLEFQPARDAIPEGAPVFDLARMSYRDAANAFDLLPGQWTDDASMGLCLADSLILRGGYDGSDVRARFWNWWFRGYNNAFRLDPTRTSSVGLGGNISRSLFAMKPGEPPAPRYESAAEDSGNGSIMRLAAVPIFFHDDPAAAAIYGAESSLTTHPGAVAREACCFLAWLLARAIGMEGRFPDAATFLEDAAREAHRALALRSDPGGRTLRALLEASQPDDSLERSWNWRSPTLDIEGTLRRRGERYNGYPVLPTYYGSYCIDGLALALHAVYHTRSFDEAVVRCANHLGDADSTSAVAGQIAGAIYGYSAIDPRLVANLNRWDDGEVALRGAILYELGAARAALPAPDSPAAPSQNTRTTP